MPVSITPLSPTAYYGVNGTNPTIPFTAYDQDGNTLLVPNPYVPAIVGSGLALDITAAGPITAAVPHAGGNGINYNIGDSVTVTTGGADCTLWVKTLNASGEGVGTLVSGSAAGANITNCGTAYATTSNVPTTFGTSALSTPPLTWSLTAGTATLANAGTINSVTGLYTPPTTGTAGQNFHVNVANNLGIASGSAIVAPSTLVTLMPNTGSTGVGTTLNAPPLAPTGLAGTGGIGNAILSWTQPGGGSTPTSWTVYWGTTGPLAVAKTNSFGCTSPCTITVPNDANHFFVVTATNLNGEGPESNTFGPIMSLTAPTGVSVAPDTATAATLTWTKDVNATSSNIYFKTTSPAYPTGTKILGATSAVVGNVTPLTANTVYYVGATSAIAGQSESSSTEVTYVPAPGGASVTPAPGSAAYSWTAVTGATSYNVYYTTDGTTPAETAGSPTGTTTKITGATSGGSVTKLSGGSTFKFIVTANVSGTESLPSSVASGLVLFPTVSTLAGTALNSGSTDASGSAARFNLPYGVTTDGVYLYVGDGGNGLIRQVEIATGLVTTIASGFSTPIAITTDSLNLYVADTNNNVIKQMAICHTLNCGTPTTIAGSGGLASVDGTGTSAEFANPWGITTDGTNLYTTDTSSNTIRQIVISSGVVTTIAGTAGTFGSADGTGAAATFHYPVGITTDGVYLYVVESSVNEDIRQVEIATGIVITIANGFNGPNGVATDGTNLYVADTNNNVIKQMAICHTLNCGTPTTIAGTGAVGHADGTGTVATFNLPYGLATDGTNLYVADTSNDTIRKIFY